MRVLSEFEYQNEAEQAFRKCFLNDDPRVPEFGVNAEETKLLYEYIPPAPKIINAIVAAASRQEETGFYLSVLTRNVQDREALNHWWVSFDEVQTYLSCNTDVFQFAYQLEAALYSSSGSWAVVRSFQNFGLLVGKKDIIQEICLSLPEVEQQVFDFLRYVHECKHIWGAANVDVHWLPTLLERIYGERVATEMLHRSELT